VVSIEGTGSLQLSATRFEHLYAAQRVPAVRRGNALRYRAAD
jgi:hypothetical protein